MRKSSVWVVEIGEEGGPWVRLTAKLNREAAREEVASNKADEYEPPNNKYRVVRYDASK